MMLGWAVLVCWLGMSTAVMAADPPLKPKNIVIAVTKDGTILWNGKPTTCEQMQARFLKIARKAGTPNRHLFACRMTPDPNLIGQKPKPHQ